MKKEDEIEELDKECCEIDTRIEFDLSWTCPNCKKKNIEYNIPTETLITCICYNCRKEYKYIRGCFK